MAIDCILIMAVYVSLSEHSLFQKVAMMDIFIATCFKSDVASSTADSQEIRVTDVINKELTELYLTAVFSIFHRHWCFLQVNAIASVPFYYLTLYLLPFVFGF